MKILSFQEFAALPSGVVFSHFEPMFCDGLFRKGNTLLGPDGSAVDFLEAEVAARCPNGDHPTVEYCCWARWGMYDYSQQFAVYEDADLEILRRMLTPGDEA